MFVFKVIKRLCMHYKCRFFHSCGKGVVFDPISSYLSYRTISLGESTYIGPQAYISSTHSQINIGRHVIIGPGVSIFGGDHIHDVVGVPMALVKKNSDTVDANVTISDEVWIGGGVIVLTGVTIGRGAIIGAGSVVTKDVDAYAIAAGNPCRKIAERFSKEQKEEHERILYGHS